MSDPQTPPKKTKSQELQEQIDQLKKQQEQLTTLTSEDAVNHIDNCPTCKAKVKAKLQDEILKEHQVEAHSQPAVPQPTREEVLKGYLDSLKGKQVCKCKECEMIVPTENEKCPFCGSTKGTVCSRKY